MPIDPSAEKKFRIDMSAVECLAWVLAVRQMQTDPEFATFARQWIDSVFGSVSGSEEARKLGPETISDVRAQFLDLIERSESSIRLLASGSKPPKPRNLRRRIFEWFERA
jgi:hypothetical protein